MSNDILFCQRLTAAFPFPLLSTPSVLTITVGDVTLGTAESTEQVFRVVRQIVHEDYGATTAQEHDIMLIELDVGPLSSFRFPQLTVCGEEI